MAVFDFCTLQWKNNSHQRIYILIRIYKGEEKRGDIVGEEETAHKGSGGG